jgi:mono/diheme cytochrome c family protein
MRRIVSRLGILGTIAAGAVIVFLLAQAVPYGHDHSNPTPTRTLRFDSARTAQLFGAACADCHSDRTRWPWYSNVAPMSWLIEHDVQDGRETFDVSRWDRGQPDPGEIAESVAEGEMPPTQYKLIHGGARLSNAERQELAAGLTRSIRADPPGGSP